MQRLKIILHSKIIIIFFIISFIYILTNLLVDKKSVYKEDTNTFICIIDSYYISDTYLNMSLSCDENLVGYKYFNNEEEIESFKETYNLKDKVKIEGTLEEYTNNKNINMFDVEEYYKIKNIFYKVKISNIEKVSSYNKIYYLYNYYFKKIDNLKSKPYIYSLVLGNKNYLDKDMLSIYKSIGIMHMFSVSGMHINMIVELINKIYSKENKRKNKIILSILFLYYLIVKTLSIERALISYIITVLNHNYDLNINKYYKILLIIVILLLINPMYIYSSSFYLSIITSSFLILLSDKIKSNNIFINTLYVSIISFIVSLPLIGYLYNEVNILSIIYNVISSIIISNIIFPLSILTIFINIFDYPLYIIISIFEYIIKSLSSLSITLILKRELILVIIYYLILILSLYKRKYIPLYILVFIIHINYNSIFKSNYVYYFDVGQGDSTLISNDNKYYLIDTGGISGKKPKIVENTTIPVLKSLGINKIDTLILTHGDYDHMGEAIVLVNNFNVDKVIFNCGDYNDLEEELIKELDNKKINYYKCIKKIDSLYFLNTRVYDNENDNSSVIYTSINNYKLLFMGDAGKDKELDIIKKYNISNIDVLKVGHHGSNTSSDKSFINKMNPKYSVISVGLNNKYGHPNKETLNNLKESIIYRTDISGGIMINNKLEIDTYT